MLIQSALFLCVAGLQLTHDGVVAGRNMGRQLVSVDHIDRLFVLVEVRSARMMLVYMRSVLGHVSVDLWP